jgi:hypothetical protein
MGKTLVRCTAKEHKLLQLCATSRLVGAVGAQGWIVWTREMLGGCIHPVRVSIH